MPASIKFSRLVALGAMSAVLVAGCGGDDEPGQQAAEQAAGDVERYCQLTAQLDQAGERAFENVPESAGEEAIQAAVRRLFEENRAMIEEVQRVAPQEIRDDVRTFVAGQRRAAEVGEEAFTPQVQQADERLQAFEKRNCDDRGGATTGEEGG